jgi:hypothetical protein
MRPIERWFKGPATCGGFTAGKVSAESWRGGQVHCLFTARDSDLEVDQLAAIIARLFPERACRCPGARPSTQVIHFNNHPATTRDDVDKIVHTLALEA